MTSISSPNHREIYLLIIYTLIASCVFFSPALSNAQTRSVIGMSYPSKVIILTFGDTHKSQFTNAKPILDKYGFKGSFFVTCLWVGSSPLRLTWQDISALQKDGQDIESKTMTHRKMTHLSPNDLNYEIAGSKKCLADHGINTTAIATTHGNGRSNETITNEISKYYDIAVDGFGKLTILHCNIYTKYSSQTDCRTYFNNGTLTFANRYSIMEWSHNNIDKANFYNDSKIFNIFVDEVNSQEKYNNKDGPILAVPIIGYHNINNNKTPDSTNLSLFAQEMKYLHDNGFRVLTLNDLGYDTKNNFLYIKSLYHTPNLTSHYIVKVTRVANNKPSINTPVPQRVSSINNSKLLLISLHLAKNHITAGSKETLKARVIDAANSNLTIAGARVNGTITDSNNTTRMNFNGTTDNSGIFSYTWKVNKGSKPGLFTVGVHASTAGYQNQLIPTTTAFDVNSGGVHKTNSGDVHKTGPQNRSVNCRTFIITTNPCS